MNVLILTATTDFTMKVLISLPPPEFTCHVMGAGNLIGIRFSRYCKKYISCRHDDFFHATCAMSEKINAYCHQNKIDIILPADLEGIFLLSKIKNKLSPLVRLFPTAETEQLKILNNKWSFSQFLDKHRIPQPRTMLLSSMESLKTVPIKFPVIVKPPALGNSIGVKKLDALDALYQHISQKHAYNKPPLLLQEYIPGKDVDLNVLAENGHLVAWSIQEWITDSSIRFIENKDIEVIGRNIISALKYTGIAHFDMRIDERDGSVKVIECNPRFWGTLRASVWNGTNFVHAGILMAQGKKNPSRENRKISYMVPVGLLTTLFTGKLSIIKKVPFGTRRDLWTLLADPLSCLYLLFKMITKPHNDH